MSRPKIDAATRERLAKILGYIESAPKVAQELAVADAARMGAKGPNHSFRLGGLEQMVRNAAAELRAVLA